MLIGNGGAIKVVDISTNGQEAIIASFDCTLMLGDLNRETEFRTFYALEDPANDVVILLDGRHTVSACDDDSLWLWQLGSNRLLHDSEGHQTKDAQEEVSPDGVLTASAGWDRKES